MPFWHRQCTLALFTSNICLNMIWITMELLFTFSHSDLKWDQVKGQLKGRFEVWLHDERSEDFDSGLKDRE